MKEKLQFWNQYGFELDVFDKYRDSVTRSNKVAIKVLSVLVIFVTLVIMVFGFVMTGVSYITVSDDGSVIPHRGLSTEELIYGPVLLEAVFEKSEITEAIGTVWMALRWLVALGLLYLVVSVLFYTLPSLRLPYRQVVPGTLVTSVGIILVSAIYNFYMRFNVNYDILYGSLAGAVGLLIWLWAVGWVILIGIVFNRVWWAVRDENKVPIPTEVIDKRVPTGLF